MERTTPTEPGPPAVDSAAHTFLIADVRGYTRFTLERGDKAAAQLASRFSELVQEVMAAAGGRVVELRGDEALCVFSSARLAFQAALALHARIAAPTPPSSLPFAVGIGIDAGEAIPVGKGYRGAALNLAARLCALAGPEEVLASAAVVHLAGPIEGITYRERGPTPVKGFVRPVDVVEVVREEEPPVLLPPPGSTASRGVSQFGMLLRQYRDAVELTQEELAARSGVSVRAISDLERGAKTRPQRTTIRLLSEGLSLGEAERAALEASVPSRHRPSDQTDGALDRHLSISAPGTPPTNLLVEPAPFIGRRQEMAALDQLLQRPQVQLVTLTGPGGSGKTRLGLEVASARLPAYRDGVFMVSLASLADPALVAPTIAATLDVKETGEQPLLDTLQRALRDRHLLLVLDNFEHLLGAAPLVGDLMRSCPSLQILVTSRAILRLTGEHEFPVPPLSLPELDLRQDLRALAQSDAVAFFVDRARAARPDFVLTKENGPYIAALCHRLDGLPLGLELAAARARLFSPQALLERLAHRFDLLTGGARDRPTRQHTLRCAIDWSYSLLLPEEQTLFARLAVFAGGWTLEVSEEVCATEGEQSLAVLSGVASLAEQNLVRQEGDTEYRFGMLETIRAYAAEKLAQSEEEWQIREAHARYFHRMGQEAAPDLNGPNVGGWLQRLEREQDNIRSALGWLRDHGEPVIGLELATALGAFWIGRGHAAEGLDWLRTFLTKCPESTELRGRALNDASFLAVQLGATEEARCFAEESVRIARNQGDAQQVGRALVSLSWVMQRARDIERVLDITGEGIAIARRIEDSDLLGMHLLSRAEGMRLGRNYAEARRLYEESLEIYRGLEMVEMVVSNLHNLIEIELDDGNSDQAAKLFGETVQLAHRLRHAWIDAYTVLHFARLAAARENLPLAARSLGAAARMFQSMGLDLEPNEQASYDSVLSLLHAELADEERASLWEEGWTLSADDAMAYVRDESGRILGQ